MIDWYNIFCLANQVVFISSIIRFRTPTQGNYEYPGYANALGWLMVCSSIIFIPIIMIYEFIKAWKVTNSPQYQVKILFLFSRRL